MTQRTRGGATIECPQCKTPTKVLRTNRNGQNNVYRTRYCEDCDITWRSRERVVGKPVPGCRNWWPEA